MTTMPDETVHPHNILHLETRPHLVDSAREDEPPKARPHYDGQITEDLLYAMTEVDELETRKQSHEEEDDERIAQRHQEARKHIMRQGALAMTDMVRRHRTGKEGKQPEEEQQDAATYLEVDHRTGPFDEVHDEGHAQSGDEGINDIAKGGTQPGDETIPSTFVQGTLHNEHPHGSHGSAGNNAY